MVESEEFGRLKRFVEAWDLQNRMSANLQRSNAYETENRFKQRYN